MGKNYSHLTSKDRIAISTLLRAGHSKAFIAKQLGVHRSTIYREVDRNSTRIGYLQTIKTNSPMGIKPYLRQWQ